MAMSASSPLRPIPPNGSNPRVALRPSMAPEGTPDDAALAAFQVHGTERMIAVQIYEFEIKTISRVTARWHLEAFVYDRSGNILARRATRGFEPVRRIGRQGSDADIAMKEIIRRLSELLDEPVISRALN